MTGARRIKRSVVSVGMVSSGNGVHREVCWEGSAGIVCSQPEQTSLVATLPSSRRAPRESCNGRHRSRRGIERANPATGKHTREGPPMPNTITGHAGFGQEGPTDQPLLDTTAYGSGPDDSITDATEAAAVTHHVATFGGVPLPY